MSSKQSMSRLKSGTGVARVRENPVAREYAYSLANFQRFMWAVPLFLAGLALHIRFPLALLTHLSRP
jgi:hypothetical protein